MPYVVQQRRQPHRQLGITIYAVQLAPLRQRRQRPPGEMVRPQRMLKTGMGGAWIHQERMPQLPHIPKPLHRRRVQHRQRGLVQPDVVPQRVADYVVVHGCRGKETAGTATA